MKRTFANSMIVLLTLLALTFGVTGVTPANAASASITTLFSAMYGASGNMFDVTAINALTITSFDINCEGTNNILVYYKAGTYVGFETNAGAWTLLGTQTVNCSGINSPTPLAIGGLTIPAGQTYGLYITDDGTVNMLYTGGSSTYSNADIQLTLGAAVAYPFAGFIPSRTWNGTIYYTDAPAVGLSTASIDFGDQLFGTTSAAQTVTLTNTGTADLHIGLLSFISDWILSNDTCSNVTVIPAGTCTFDVTFHPLALGPLTGSITIPSDAASSPDTVDLSGNGVAPAVDLSTTSIDFGYQLLGTTSAAQTVTLTNTGTADLNIGTLSFTSDWILSNDTCSSATVIPAGTCTFDVAFHPLALGPLTGSITIPSDASTSPDSVSLSGTGTAPAVGLSTTSINFGDQLLGTTSPAQAVTLTNTGTADLHIGLLSFTSDWILSNDTCSSATVIPAGTCTFDVAFHPLALGPLSGSITIPSDAVSNPDTVTLNGTGVDTTPPVLTVPANMVVNATSAAGAFVTFTASATDLVDATPTVACAPPSGSTFPLGVTTVNCTATDDSGNTDSDSFTITVQHNPNQVTLYYPANTEHTNSVKVNFDWSDYPGATGYQAQFSYSPTLTNPFLYKYIAGPISTLMVNQVPVNRTIYWRVRARTGLTYSAWSQTFSFHSANPPSTPRLLKPLNGALSSSLSPVFDWANSVIPTGAIFDHYRIQIATDSAFTNIIHDLNINGVANSQDNTALLFSGTTYYWRVQAFNSAGDFSAWSAVWRVRIQ